MPNRIRILLILCLPSMLLLVLAWLADVELSRLGSLPSFANFMDAFDWIPPVLVVAALLWLAWAAIRLARWELGKGPDCHRCGGLLGRDRRGLYGDYRKCLGCGKAISHRHYAWPR